MESGTLTPHATLELPPDGSPRSPGSGRCASPSADGVFNFLKLCSRHDSAREERLHQLIHQCCEKMQFRAFGRLVFAVDLHAPHSVQKVSRDSSHEPPFGNANIAPLIAVASGGTAERAPRLTSRSSLTGVYLPFGSKGDRSAGFGDTPGRGSTRSRISVRMRSGRKCD